MEEFNKLQSNLTNKETNPAMNSEKLKKAQDENEEEDWGDWDPMAQHWFNPSVNSYLSGPGAQLPLHLQSRAYQNKATDQQDSGTVDMTKLFIPNLPTAIENELDLADYVLAFGVKPDQIAITQTQSETRIACLSFSSTKAGRDALCAIYDKPPYRFQPVFGERTA